MHARFYIRTIICFKFVVLLFFCGITMATVNAQALHKPTGSVLLTVSGLISQRNSNDAAVFDAAMLDALPSSQIVTKTPWHMEPARFSGPSLKTLMRSVGSKGKVLRLIALDKYEVSIPTEDIESYNPILAIRMDGKDLNIRSRGPVLLMYPFDSFSRIDTEVYFGRAVWQLVQIVIE